ncbi:MAG TPA: hypothetical protein VI451_13385, partial [Anaerolineales bacterium]|nr:hypothetical protein [Anaerolineales bacterium]
MKGHGDLASRLADAVGISLAFPAMIGLGSFLFGWRFSGTAVVWVYGLVGLAVLVGVFRWMRRRKDNEQRAMSNEQLPITKYRLPIINFLPLLLFALLLAFRFYQARDLVVPAWVDSVHHVLLVRLFLETGGVPPTIEPYIQAPLIYHFGFHVNAALFAFFGRLSLDQAVLIFGQVINAFVSLAIYRLGMAMWQDWRRAVVTMLLTGFVFQMPAYYLTWGRYTLLTGLSLMILGMAAALEVVQSPGNGVSRPPGVDSVPRLAVLVSAVLLTHYFAAGL